MSDQNKDNLENFFRERAQQHNIEFNENDWLKLEAKLDVEMPVGFTFWSFIKKFWYLPILILFIPTSWFSYKQFSKERNAEQYQQTLIQSNINESSESQNNSRIIEDKTIDSSTYNQAAQDKKSEAQIIPGNNTKYEDQLSVDNKAKLKTEVGFVSKEKSVEPISNNIGYAVYENGAETLRHNRDSKLHFLFPIPPESNISASEQPKVTTKEFTSDLVPLKQKAISYYVGIGYSPDFSTVGLGNFIAPGSRWTAIAEIGIRNRFKVNTGVVWVNNKYEAYGEDYHAPYRYWQNGIVADQAYGECVMIDIPLNLRYNFWIKDRHQLFISGGASTYFLLKEDYWFHYEQNDPNLPQYWGTDDMSIYPFGIINFSFGYQYALRKRGSLQVEPFIKIPTAGVGWGNVDLHTIGAYVIYKYRIGK